MHSQPQHYLRMALGNQRAMRTVPPSGRQGEQTSRNLYRSSLAAGRIHIVSNAFSNSTIRPSKPSYTAEGPGNYAKTSGAWSIESVYVSSVQHRRL